MIALTTFTNAPSGLVRARAMDQHKPSRNTQTSSSAILTDAEISELSKLLHVGDAAKFLAVSKRTLQQLTADRAVAHIKFNRNVRYDIADLRRFAESRKIREIGWKTASKKATTASTGGSL